MAVKHHNMQIMGRRKELNVSFLISCELQVPPSAVEPFSSTG